jgi:transitional endoplasmic reticulum ATPase
MLARIIASRSGAKFYEISGPEIFSKWYGQSEELLRMIFDRARKQPRSIVFFDEIDSVAAHRDDDAHEASRRVVAQLLTLMDGFSADDNVVVIAATNRPQAIDIALRRPGRFDWEITFPYPNRSDREEILEIGERKHSTRGDLPHTFVAAQTDGWSGASLAAIWTEAALLAVTDDRDAIAAEDYLGGYERVAAQREVQMRTLRRESVDEPAR